MQKCFVFLIPLALPILTTGCSVEVTHVVGEWVMDHSITNGEIREYPMVENFEDGWTGTVSATLSIRSDNTQIFEVTSSLKSPDDHVSNEIFEYDGTWQEQGELYQLDYEENEFDATCELTQGELRCDQTPGSTAVWVPAK